VHEGHDHGIPEAFQVIMCAAISSLARKVFLQVLAKKVFGRSKEIKCKLILQIA
jgi:hypothetical protein